MNKPPQITFAIPFYGSMEYLRQAILSVCGQTIDDWNVMVVDDCSPEGGARDLVATFDDPRIAVSVNKENLGLSGNWNRCIELSNGRLLTILHSDDELSPRYGEQMLAAHAAWPNAAAIFCNARIIDEQGDDVYSFRDVFKRLLVPRANRSFVLAGEEGVRSLLRGNFIICPSLCYKRTFFERLRFSSDWKFLPDLDLIVRGLMAGNEYVGLPQTAFRYRRHLDQATVGFERSMEKFHEEARYWRWAQEQSRLLGWNQASAVAEKMAIVKLQLAYYAAGDILHFRFGRALEKLALLGSPARLRSPDL